MSASNTADAAVDWPRIAVIGAGAAGLAAARVLTREGYPDVTVLEKESEGGGVWKYVAGAPDRPVYRGLRTNLPKELMAYREFPFPVDDSNDASFVPHERVQDYLLAYRDHYSLNQYIRYDCSVNGLRIADGGEASRISPLGDEAWPKIRLDWTQQPSSQGDGSTSACSEVFDAVLVCNGHYAAPSIPEIPNLRKHFSFVPSLDGFERGDADRQRSRVFLHSIAYDDPASYAGRTVLCVGGRASGADLAREISHHAEHVYLSDTGCTEAVCEDGEKVTLVPRTIGVNEDGSIRLDHGCPIAPEVDTIVFCSGYDYAFPFITDPSAVPAEEEPGAPEWKPLELGVAVGERRVTPLLEQLWHADHPSVAFVGLPHSVVPFPLFEFQVEAVCAQWRREAAAAAPLHQPRSVRREAARKEAEVEGRRVQDTHFLGNAQWDYCRKLASEYGPKGGEEDIEAYLQTNQQIYDHAGKARKSGSPGGPDSYRSIRYRRDTTAWKDWTVIEESAEVLAN